MELEINERNRWKDITNIFERDTQFKGDLFEPSDELLEMYLESAKVLVVGAGGLGCEILKDLALSGVKDIHVIDLDTIDLTNLNRQFLFRMKDVGKFKSQVAADFIMRRVPGCKVTAHIGKIQEKDDEFYRQFQVIIAGLDNVEARRWLNSLVHGLCQFDEDQKVKIETQIRLVDGGTEGFKGQARLIVPYETACYECTLGTLPKQQSYNSCTLASTPRIPEHCIMYAYLHEWDLAFPTRKADKDSMEDMTWIYETAKKRAEQFNIKGVDYNKTIGVVKNIIPAIASTNAIIAASCANEAFKAFLQQSLNIKDYFQYMGNTGVSTLTFPYERNEKCIVCSSLPQTVKISRSTKLQELQDLLKEKPFELTDPSLTADNGSMLIPVVMRNQHAEKLPMSFTQLIAEGHYQEGLIIHVTDKKLFAPAKIQIHFTD
ncbi:ubiquitin-activating enzyme E1, protein (macronuclear) [Tetrahymena thermophila SB210]|uniref:NEDD8-activating enzyme E1 catalytic subunit n=1 Tax=Tetrahymena thermophila (strain SB210) TaxID=312017 RepID=Q22T77_TETTS|nr:ubiquitin-activating enzyme E1, protein [Tetrahymena thermophila SB210]EAR88561.1 ubiquitin-activating enzyme E1, protein [Tetrahymena thermophila SB210]|eukprot:XP_001008806.1 ubiquitin-activating enzyme E1, protein [Tetrahymena thermophila SB210]